MPSRLTVVPDKSLPSSGVRLASMISPARSNAGQAFAKCSLIPVITFLLNRFLNGSGIVVRSFLALLAEKRLDDLKQLQSWIEESIAFVTT